MGLSLSLTMMAGCGTSGNAPTAGGGSDADPTGHSAKDVQAEITEAFAKLTAEDRQLAQQQKICPVSDEPLGTMGTPPKIDVKGRSVFICCEGCKEELLNNADKYLAKLDQPQSPDSADDPAKSGDPSESSGQ
jgi:hypothetical protein